MSALNVLLGALVFTLAVLVGVVAGKPYEGPGRYTERAGAILDTHTGRVYWCGEREELPGGRGMYRDCHLRNYEDD
jgi:hypothetical protein